MLEGVQVIDFEHKYLYVNDAAIRQNKYSREELIGFTQMEKYPGIEQTLIFNKIKTTLIQRTSQQSENAFTFPDGTCGWYEVRIIPVPEGALILSLVITEKKHAQDILLETTKQIRAILDNTPALVYIKGLNGKLQFVNKKLKSFFGDQFNITEQSNPESLVDYPEGEDITVITNKETITKEVTFQQSYGNQYYYATKFPLIDRNGDAYGMCGILTDFTEYKKTQIKHQESEHKFSYLFQSVPAGISLSEAESGIFHDVNQKWLEFTGFNSKEDVIGKTISGLGLIGDEKQYSQIIESLNANDFVKNGEINIRTRTGNSRTFLVNLSNIFIDGKKYILTTCNDITELNRTLEALNESEKNLRHSQAIAHLGHWTWNTITNEVQCSDEMKRIFGLDPDSFSGNLTEIIDQRIFPDDRDKFIEAGKAAPVQESQVPIEYRIVLPGGSIRYILAIPGDRNIDENGNTVKLSGIIQDITDRKIAELKLIEEKERLAVTLRSIGDGVIATDVSGNITMLNGVAEQLTGWTSEEALGRPISDIFNIVHKTTGLEYEKQAQSIIRTGLDTELSNNSRLISRRKKVILLENSGSPIKNNSGDVIGVVIVFRDITEKQKLIQSAQRADKLEAIGILAGGIAHDFNNLLGGIFGYIDIARMYCEPGSKIEKNINKALDTFTAAKDLTQKLLTFSKGGAPDRKKTSLKPVLKDKTLCSLGESRTTCVFNLQDDLWQCDIDEYQIGQVVENVVTNALEAMPQGGSLIVSANNKTIHENSGVLNKGNYVICTFQDTGNGIPQNIISSIFDPFFTTKPKGNGLGLSTAYSIIRKHDGDIIVESDIDKGTTVHVYIPASSANAIPTIEKPEPARKHGKVMVMDDEEFIREILGDMLKSMGFEVDFALNGQEVLQKLQQSHTQPDNYKAVIMDLTIPGAMGGKETIRKLRELNSKIPAFVSSGYADDPVMADPNRFGFTDKIQKPFRKKDLQELITRHLM